MVPRARGTVAHPAEGYASNILFCKKLRIIKKFWLFRVCRVYMWGKGDKVQADPDGR